MAKRTAGRSRCRAGSLQGPEAGSLPRRGISVGRVTRARARGRFSSSFAGSSPPDTPPGPPCPRAARAASAPIIRPARRRRGLRWSRIGTRRAAAARRCLRPVRCSLCCSPRRRRRRLLPGRQRGATLRTRCAAAASLRRGAARMRPRCGGEGRARAGNTRGTSPCRISRRPSNGLGTWQLALWGDSSRGGGFMTWCVAWRGVVSERGREQGVESAAPW